MARQPLETVPCRDARESAESPSLPRSNRLHGTMQPPELCLVGKTGDLQPAPHPCSLCTAANPLPNCTASLHVASGALHGSDHRNRNRNRDHNGLASRPAARRRACRVCSSHRVPSWPSALHRRRGRRGAPPTARGSQLPLHMASFARSQCPIGCWPHAD